MSINNIMNKKVVISLLVIILLLTILCLKITLVEFFSSNTHNKINNAIAGMSDLCKINISQNDPKNIEKLSECIQNSDISSLIKIAENLSK